MIRTPTLARLRNLDPTILLWVLLIGILLVLVANPLIRLGLVSLQGPETGALTFSNYVTAYGKARYLEALWNSILLGLGVCVICLVLAVPTAWAISRTDMPGKSAIRILFLGAFITPPYLGAIAWMLLAAPNAGWLNQMFMDLSGAKSGLLDIYTFPGLTFVVAIYTFPYIFIFTSAALDLVSSEMEDAANILGAGTWRTTLTITLPLVLPAILAGLIITFLEAIAVFGAPAFIALPARINVLTTQLWQFFSFMPIRVEVAAAYAMPLLAITVALYWLQQRILRRKGYVALTGKGSERRMIRLGPYRWILFAYAMLVAALSVILPYLVLAQAALSKAWGRGFSFENLTFQNFYYLLFEHQTALQSVLNTFLYASATACLALGLAFAIAYIVNRRLVPFEHTLSFLCMAPFVIPGIVLAIGFYAAYAPPPLALYGTATIVVLALTARFLPIAFANASAAMRSINTEMEEAVRILGGGRLLVIRRVLVPLLKKSLLGAWLLVLIPAMRELSALIFLYGPKTRTISVMLFDLSEEGNVEHLAALGFLLLFSTIAIVAVGYKFVGRDFMVRGG